MSVNPFETIQDVVDTSPEISDEIKYTTCYMCACRCGIKVHLKDGKIRYIEGNRNHPVNQGVLCAKGSAGIMQHYSPARLTKPLKRVGDRGAGEFKEIEWEEALKTASSWLSNIRKTDPKRLAFFTGRDQSQGLTGFWASQFGTPNHAAHGGFCSVNMAAAGLYTIGGSFWEFGEPDWENTKYFIMFGVAEDHDSNPIKIGLGKLKNRGAKFVSVNPIKTGYSAIADQWIGIRPGTDGLLVLSIIHELLKSNQIDLDYLVRYTNAPWLVVQDEGASDHGLFARDDEGNPISWNKINDTIAPALATDISPALVGSFTLPDGRQAVPAFHLLAERYLSEEYKPETVAKTCGLKVKTIKRLAAEIAQVAFQEAIELDIEWTDWAGRKHNKIIGRPVSMHAMRGISAHSNGFHTCRALHLLQILLGSIDAPGGFRYKPPFPKPAPPPLKPAGKPDQIHPETPMPGPPLGFPTGPEDLLVDEEGKAVRIDKAFSWEAPLSAHGLMHMVINNAWKGDPYPIDTLFMYMANMSWNSSMNIPDTIKMLTDKEQSTGEYKIPRIIYSDAFYSEMIPYCDLILPDTTYLERWDCISLLDRPICDADGVADSIRQPVLIPDRDVRPFQDVLIDLGTRLALPAFVRDNGEAKYPGGYQDYIVNHERSPGIGPLAGFRGKDGKSEGKGPVNPKQLDKYVENQCFWRHEFHPTERYFKHSNKAYLEKAVNLGLIGSPNQIILQLYLEPLQKFRLAANGYGKIQPPIEHRERIKTYFDPLPIYYKPFEEEIAAPDAFPLHAITQRPMAMYHSWGSQNAWLRQIHGFNHLYISRSRAQKLGIKTDDWVYVTSSEGRLKAQIKLMEGVNEDTVWTWNAIGKRRGAWNLSSNAPEGTKGFLLNHIISQLLPEKSGGYRYANSDPITGQAAWFDLRVRVEKAEDNRPGVMSAPQFSTIKPVYTVSRGSNVSRFGSGDD
ncbi:MAG: formate dehydrogenase [Rhodospirillaceae bacterium]|nr:formate dehydrogenase [Rhodospirillaceae bacterium]